MLEATYLGDVLGNVLGEVLRDDQRAWYFERCSAEEKYMYCMVGTVLLSCCTRTYIVHSVSYSAAVLVAYYVRTVVQYLLRTVVQYLLRKAL